MDFILGILTGVIMTLLLVAAGFFYLSRAPTADLGESDPPASGPPDVSVTLDQGFISSELARNLRQADKRLIGARLELQPGNRADLDVGIRVDVLNLKVTVQPHVMVRFMLNRGQVRVRVLDMNIGRVHLPILLVRGIVEQLLRRAEAELNEPLRLIESSAHIRVVELQTDEEVLILNFRRVPNRPMAPTPLPPELVEVPPDSELDNVLSAES